MSERTPVTQIENAADAVYENGTLRLLSPLSLPEHTQVKVIVMPVSAATGNAVSRARVRAALEEARVRAALDVGIKHIQPLSVAERAAIASAIAEGPSLSEIIIRDRD